ncbi:MAG TPA: FHA domain-containing protein [Anaerolineaceae bacterium]|nr:FHA domain-containing protein [Anaerolineaceae bacterium]HPN50763.1 FHA domain-containing protein [Anaerolineaceae bacterium]
MLKSKLDQIEKRLQYMIEGSLSAILPWSNPRASLAHQLVQAMQANLQVASDGAMTAPNVYNIQVHPSRREQWDANPTLLTDMAKGLYQAGLEAGFQFRSEPTLHITSDVTLPMNDIRVSSYSGPPPLSDTAIMSIGAMTFTAERTEPIVQRAYLINGNDYIELGMRTISIGRREDNELVINDPRVSRAHAQLRAIKGKHVLFDLNSTGGTFVNNQRITQCNLSSGDVISLAGYILIYTQETPPGADTGSFPTTPANLPPEELK